jgi:excisionase family DNA binding protein
MDEQKEQVTRRSYRVEEVAESTGLSIGMIRKEINAGRLRKVKVGRAVVILVEDLEKWLQSYKETTNEVETCS